MQGTQKTPDILWAITTRTWSEGNKRRLTFYTKKCKTLVTGRWSKQNGSSAFRGGKEVGFLQNKDFGWYTDTMHERFGHVLATLWPTGTRSQSQSLLMGNCFIMFLFVDYWNFVTVSHESHCLTHNEDKNTLKLETMIFFKLRSYPLQYINTTPFSCNLSDTVNKWWL